MLSMLSTLSMLRAGHAVTLRGPPPFEHSWTTVSTLFLVKRVGFFEKKTPKKARKIREDCILSTVGRSQLNTCRKNRWVFWHDTRYTMQVHSVRVKVRTCQGTRYVSYLGGTFVASNTWTIRRENTVSFKGWLEKPFEHPLNTLSSVQRVFQVRFVKADFKKGEIFGDVSFHWCRFLIYNWGFGAQ